MSQEVHVGVDSGGTRTNVALATSVGGSVEIFGSYEVGHTLSGALKPELIPSTLRRILAPLELHLGDHSPGALRVHLWISAAGFSPWTRDEYLAAMESLLPELLDGAIVSAGAANDGVSLLLGSRADGIIIAGTGSTVIVQDASDVLHQAGGHEWVACDQGSGFWIGMRGIREAYRDHEAGTDSVLLQRLKQQYGVRGDNNRRLIEKMRDLAVGHEDQKKEIARFAAEVCAAAERGDKASQNIVKAEAEELADVAAGTLRRRFTSEELVNGIDLIQCGGLLSNDFYRASFESQVEMRLLTGSERKASVRWRRVGTGGQAAVTLASDLAEGAGGFMRLDRAFRPAIAEGW
ncbi:BadF/BadG/BcrA/BcrD ATPase family protein [Miltoncostaea oceani]|uniref:BadF/BadG/BcrA/BcrD ATPase family protein n=1 Tax=Miltoncostaea oceani TaxID=2843216 RepID=UPI001C3CB000|nr:BadF/BadG/BcrA/BcrD ATPase family protein [Miltoncostaea oceani]